MTIENEKHYIVHWKNRITGKTGYGQPMNYHAAQDWARQMNAKYPKLEHSVVDERYDFLYRK
jgi:hypothetical protein